MDAEGKCVVVPADLIVRPVFRPVADGKCDYCSKEGPTLTVDFYCKWPGYRVGHVSIHESARDGDPCGLILAGILKSYRHLDGMC
jgi:hypothetical protein